MNDPQPKRRRRWYQFSLRTLMLFMLVCAVVSAWVGWKLDQTRREQRALDEIKSWRGHGAVHIRYPKGPRWITRHFGRAGSIHSNDRQVSDGRLRRFAVFTEVESVHFNRNPITDAGLAHLQGLTQVEWLRLRHTKITDAGLVHLAEMTNLRWLSIGCDGVTPRGLDQLRQKLPECQISPRCYMPIPVEKWPVSY